MVSHAAAVLRLHEHYLPNYNQTPEVCDATEADLLPNWTLRTGDKIHSVSTKYEVIRMSFCQIVHHRAQLGVYLRLLNISIPGSYGPSADEMNF